MTHVSVFLQEAIDALNIKPNGLYVDATYGRGGHTALILERLGAQGKLLVFDQDAEAIADAQQKYGKDARVSIIHRNFSALEAELRARNMWGEISGILFDLGISSPQVDEARRGFSFMQSGPLDMRMNEEEGIPLSQKLDHVSEAELSSLIFKYGEERFAKKIARCILEARQQNRLHSTTDLAELIEGIIPRALQQKHKHAATRTFQALRLWVNQELESLEQVLSLFPGPLEIGGRAVFISFHSLEDRLVKLCLQALTQLPALPRGLPIPTSAQHLPSMHVSIKMQKPSAHEVANNPRARSAVLRVMERSR